MYLNGPPQVGQVAYPEPDGGGGAAIPGGGSGTERLTTGLVK